MALKLIKTVIHAVYNSSLFDKEVNNYIIDGWELKKRGTVMVDGDISESFNTSTVKCLYAELEKELVDTFEEVTI